MKVVSKDIVHTHSRKCKHYFCPKAVSTPVAVEVPLDLREHEFAGVLSQMKRREGGLRLTYCREARQTAN